MKRLKLRVVLCILLLFLFHTSACDIIDYSTSSPTESWKVYNIENNKSNDIVLTIEEDGTGTIWAGTQNGLCVLKDTTKECFEDVFTNIRVNKIRKSNDLLFLSTEIGAYAYSNNDFYPINTIREECIDIEFYNGDFWCLFINGDISINDTILGFVNNANNLLVAQGLLWLTKNDGVYQLTTSSGSYRFKRKYSKLSGMASESCLNLFMDSRDSLWVGSYDEDGVSIISPGFIKNFHCGYISSINEDQDRAIWLGSKIYGVYQFERNGNIKSYTVNDGLPNNRINDILCDSRGNTWVATDAGIARLSKQK